MFYTNKSVRFIFLTIIALSLVLSLGRTQLVSAQSKDNVKYQLHSTNYALLGLPQAQLTTTYLFSWYNNVDIDSQLRFGVP